MLIAGRYEGTGTAKWGGMGEVHECIDKHLGRKVMLKRMQNHAELARLIDEQKALSKIRSKHVVQLLDIVSIQNQFDQQETCLVLEHIGGTDLKEGQYKADGTYLHVLWQIASGLAEIHEAGIIHRDIKPNNIRQDSDGVIKILDFGLARETGVDDKTKSIIGTDAYMAPELCGETTISFSSAIDVYAFGATALALLNGTRPPEILPPAGIAPQPLPADYIQSTYPELPTDVASVLEACFEHDIGARPSMSEVKTIIEHQIVKDKHRARIATQTEVHELGAEKRDIRLSTAVGKLNIHYDGIQFQVTRCEGDVRLNNKIPEVGDQMPPACVISFPMNMQRKMFLTFDVSHPEVSA